MTAKELIAYCRKYSRSAPPAGDIREKSTLVSVLTLLLEQHIESRQYERRRLAEASPSLIAASGAIVRGTVAPYDPREDDTARAIAVLIGYVSDLPDA